MVGAILFPHFFTHNAHKGATFSQTNILHFNMGNCSMFFELFLGILKEQFGLLYPSQYTSLGCLASTIAGVNIDTFNLTFLVRKREREGKEILTQ